MPRYRSVNRRAFRLRMLALLALFVPAVAQAQPADAEQLRLRIEAGRQLGIIRVSERRIFAHRALPAFYESRGFAPVWTSDGARLRGLLGAIDGASADGLDVQDYHRPVLDSLTALHGRRGLDAQGRVSLELLATDAALVLGSHLLSGRVNPETVDPEWVANRRGRDMGLALSKALDAGLDPVAWLDSLRPAQPGYARLRAARTRLLGVADAGGWGTVEDGPTLRPGEEGPRVVQLRRRLAVQYPELVPNATSDRFDAELEAAVVHFQRLHGLDADGAVGRDTRAAMNVPAAERARQIAINLERWRWLPDDLGTRHIRVNAAAFVAEVWDNGHVVRSHRAVVGRHYRQTPAFTGTMTYLVLAPYWHVPPTIAAVDKLPEIKKDPGYVQRQRMTLFDAVTNQPVDPSAVDWSAVSGPEFNRRFRLRQEPGPSNALGDVKFMFPNRHNVYLHDTPSRELFDRTARSFSSGCVRIDRPLELAEFLLSEGGQWGVDRIRATVAEGVERSVRLDRPVPVHLLYWTAFVDDEGALHFRPDIYGRDDRVHGALMAEPEGP